jgi:hypothetical protein
VSVRIEFASYINIDVDYAARTFSDGQNTESTGDGDTVADGVKEFTAFCDARHIGSTGYSLCSPPIQYSWDYAATIYGLVFDEAMRRNWSFWELDRRGSRGASKQACKHSLLAITPESKNVSAPKK